LPRRRTTVQTAKKTIERSNTSPETRTLGREQSINF
jgi:hypothetical protein